VRGAMSGDGREIRFKDRGDMGRHCHRMGKIFGDPLAHGSCSTRVIPVAGACARAFGFGLKRLRARVSRR